MNYCFRQIIIKIIVITLIYISCFFSVFSYAQELSADVFTVLVLKVLNYDRSLDLRVKDKLSIGVIYTSENSGQKKIAADIIKDINNSTVEIKVRKFSVEAKLIPLKADDFKGDKIKQIVSGNQVMVAVILINDLNKMNKILEVTQNLKINSFSKNKKNPAATAAFNIVAGDKKPRLILNTEKMKAEKSDYSSRLLSLCEQVGQ